MNRRELALAAAGTYGMVGLPGVSVAQTRPPEDGVDFITLDKPVRSEAPAGKVEVIDFFWYKCQHCNRFEPDLEKWLEKLPKDVHFRRVPVAFQDSFVPQQRLFFALEAMGLVDKLHKTVFSAIHVQRIALDTGEQIANWIASQGVDRAKFMGHFDSFSTNQKATRATQLQQAYRVSGVPSLGVAGLYYTDGALAPNMQRALQVVDVLVARERGKLKPVARK